MSVKRNGNGRISRVRVGLLTFRSVGSSVASHWAMACFSLIAAFGVWFVIQDVENPRVTGLVPAEPQPPSIQVEVKDNQDYIVTDPQPVKVQVEARKADLADLRPTDFDATVSVLGKPVGVPVDVPVHVTTRRNGVRILNVSPAQVTVTLQEAKVKEMPVTAHVVQPLPENYRLADPDHDPQLDPVSVKIRGLPALVDSVATVDLDINLSGARSDTVTLEGELVARTEAGNPVTVSITPARASATYKVTQTFTQRTLGLTPSTSGQPAPGFRIGNITVDPPVVTVTGPKSVVDSLQGIGAEAVNVTNARTNITQVRQVDKVSNLAIDHTTVIITVEIKPIDCGDPATAPCGGTTFTVAPTFTGATPGLTADANEYAVQVRVTGSLADLQKLKPTDIKAAVPLTNPVVGTKSYDVIITLPSGLNLKAEADQLAVTLRPVGNP